MIFDESVLGVYAVSLVEDPAIETMFMKFAKEGLIHPNCQCSIVNGEYILGKNPCEICLEKKANYDKGKTNLSSMLIKMANVEKRILVSPVLIPNQLIKRYNEKIGEFFVKIDEENILKVQQNFFKQGYQKNSTIEHNNKNIDGVFFFESWIIEDPNNDKANALGFKDLPKGTLMMSMKVENDSIWEDYIKTGKVKGFSIDSFFKLEENIKINNSKMEFNKEIIKDMVKDLLLELKMAEVGTNAEMEMPEEEPSVEIELEAADQPTDNLSIDPITPDTKTSVDYEQKISEKDAEINILKQKLADLEAKLVESDRKMVSLSKLPATDGIKDLPLSQQPEPTTKFGRILQGIQSVKNN